MPDYTKVFVQILQSYLGAGENAYVINTEMTFSKAFDYCVESLERKAFYNV